MKRYASILLLTLFLLVACKGASVPTADQASNSYSIDVVAVAMIEGQMMAIYSDDSVIPGPGAHTMLGDFDLQNGMKVKLDGTVVFPNGKVIQLQQGEAMTMDGKITQGVYLELRMPPSDR